MEITRVKFYSESDLSIGFQMERVNQILSNRHLWESYDNINDLIELFNMKLLLDCIKDRLKDNIRIQYETDKPVIMPIVAKFFTQIDNDNVAEYLLNTDFEYKEDFWALFSKFKLYKRINEMTINKLLQDKIASLPDLLHIPALVTYYGNIIRKQLLENITYSTILISEYL